MIYPTSTAPAEINTAMIRIADENNKDIDNMQGQIKNMYAQQKEMEERYDSQKTRWNNYKDAYEFTLQAYHMQNGNVNLERILELFPWGKL